MCCCMIYHFDNTPFSPSPFLITGADRRGLLRTSEWLSTGNSSGVQGMPLSGGVLADIPPTDVTDARRVCCQQRRV